MSDLASSLSAAFGYVVAFVIPGGTTMLAGFFFSHPGKNFLTYFNGSTNTSIAVLMIGTASLGVGVIVAVVRWFLFEWVFRKKLQEFDDDLFKKESSKWIDSYRFAVVEQYRYSQFCGAMALVLAPVVVGFIRSFRPGMGAIGWLMTSLVLLALVALLSFNSWQLLKVYRKRLNALSEIP